MTLVIVLVILPTTVENRVGFAQHPCEIYKNEVLAKTGKVGD